VFECNSQTNLHQIINIDFYLANEVPVLILEEILIHKKELLIVIFSFISFAHFERISNV
jgi:hypothetical protein